MWKPTRCLACLLVLLGLPAAHADDTVETISVAEAANRVVAAVEAGDRDALAKLVGDAPWLVADELCYRGEFDAARTYADVAKGPGTERLAEYVSTSRGVERSAKTHDGVQAAHEHVNAGRGAEALAVLAGLEASRKDVDGVRAWHIRGLASRLAGDIPAARAALERAADDAWALGWVAMAARAWFQASALADEAGDLESALAFLKRWKEAEAAHRDRSQWLGAVNRIGGLLERLGRLPAAVAEYEEGRQRGKDDGVPQIDAYFLSKIARVHVRLGDFARAIDDFESLIVLRDQTGNRNGAGEARVLLGNVYARMEQWDQALELQQAALAIFEETGNRQGALTARSNIGGIHMEAGRPDEAEAAIAVALEQSREMGDRDTEVRMLGYLGHLAKSRGDHALALERYLAETEAIEELGDRYGLAIALGNVAASYEQLDRLDEALATRLRAVGLAEAYGDQETLVVNLTGVAHDQLMTGHPEAALETATRAAHLQTAMARGLGEEQGARLRTRFEMIQSVGLKSAIRMGDDDAIWRFLEGGRAGALLETLDARGALESAILPPELSQAERDARAAEAEAAAKLAAAQAGGSRKEIRAAKRAHDDALAARARIADRIEREQKRAAGILYPEPAALADVQARLHEDEALLLYALVLDGCSCLVVTKEQARCVLLAGTLDEIRDASAALSLDKRDVDPKAAIGGLASLVIEPLALGDDTKRLLVSPHGVLSGVPFSVLVPGRGIAYVPSGTAYRRLEAEARDQGEGVLALGDPNYGRAPTAADETRGGPLAPLPATREEVAAVGDVVLVGDDATRTKLVQALATRERWRAVHLACHGLVDEEHPAYSSLALTAGPSDDGRLRCLDVFRMSVPADLVVLSACETAKGRLYRAEGVVGLTSAFMHAGAPRVLCSLWQVDDEATKALMVKFYELWNPAEPAKGLGAAAALKGAQEHVKSQEKWAHPYYWAAWTLWGLPD